MQRPTVIKPQPDYLIGMDDGSLVLVPASFSANGIPIAGAIPTMSVAMTAARFAALPLADRLLMAGWSLRDLATGSVLGVVDGAGNLSSVGGLSSSVRNSGALALASRRLAQARVRNVNVGLFGDSLVTSTGASAVGALPTNTVAADEFGLPGVLRARLNAQFGTRGGAWISSASPAGQVTRSSAAPLGGYGPHFALNGTNSYHINTVGAYIEWALPVCSEIKVMTWEDTATSYGVPAGAIDVSVDGGGATVYNGTGGASVQKLWQVANMTGLTAATHTVRLTRGAGLNALHGVLYHSATGVTVLSMGIGGSTTEHLRAAASGDWSPSAAQTDRVARASFQTIPLDVAIIVVGHNDASQQVARSLTPTISAANLLATINYLRANSGAPAILIVTDPWPNLTGSPLAYPDWWPALTALADGTTDVAAITTADLIGTYAEGSAEGLYSDSIHLSNAGYSTWGSMIADVLLEPRAR